MKVRKIPERRCLGCGVSYPKRDLIRVVRTPEGRIELDVTGKKNGRGAYICKNAECFKKARKKDRLKTSLGAAPSEEILDRIQKDIASVEASKASSEAPSKAPNESESGCE